MEWLNVRPRPRHGARLSVGVPVELPTGAGGIVEVCGWGEHVDGEWVASRASHSVGGAAGYVTELSAELRTA